MKDGMTVRTEEGISGGETATSVTLVAVTQRQVWSWPMALLVRENGQEKSGTSEDRKIKSSRCREVSPTKSGICRIPELSNFWLKVPSDPRKEVGPRKRFPFLEQP